MIEKDLEEWIEQVVGGSIVSVNRQGRWRPHFFVDVEKPSGEVVPLLLRFERDAGKETGSKFLARFDIEHEAMVLKALQGHGLKVPHFYGYNTDHRVILMERVGGSNDFSDIEEVHRTAVLKQYIDNLAKLHSLNPEDVEHGGVKPSTPEELALANKFGLVEQDYLKVAPQLLPEPLLEFGIWWLHENVPKNRSQVRLLQGDTGPGQFMAEGARLTALIDWELSHFGDPMLDLGVMRMRNTLYPVGPLREMIDYYDARSVGGVDRDALSYYTILAMLLSPVGLAVVVQKPIVQLDSMLARFGWDATLRRGLCEALCEAYGVEIELPEIPERKPALRSDLPRFLEEFIDYHLKKLAKDEYEEYLVNSAKAVAAAVAYESEIGHKIKNDNLEDMAVVLGHRPSNIEAGLSALSTLVRTDAKDRALDLLWLFTRMEFRREALMEPLMLSQKSDRLERLKPAARKYSP